MAEDRILAFYELPPANLRRWRTGHKILVVKAVEQGVISLPEAYKLYELSWEEFVSWRKLYSKYGKPALRTTKIQRYREKENIYAHD